MNSRRKVVADDGWLAERILGLPSSTEGLMELHEALKLVAAVLCQGELCAEQGALVVQDFEVRGNPAAKALQGSGDRVAEIFHRNFLRHTHLVILLRMQLGRPRRNRKPVHRLQGCADVPGR
jgi:hypothetical protein